jgi:hypothetical protein
VRFVNVGRNHRGDDALALTAFEVFGVLADNSPDVQFVLAGDSLDGIISELTRQCLSNVHDKNVVIVTSSPSFSGHGRDAARNVVDLRSDEYFCSVHRCKDSNIPLTPNNWICYDFQEMGIVPTHYAIRTGHKAFMRSWLVEVSSDGTNWPQIDRQENCAQTNAPHYVGIFSLSKCVVSRLVRLVNIGRNYRGDDELMICAFELFGSLLE